jgi:copper chaperone CopZ
MRHALRLSPLVAFLAVAACAGSKGAAPAPAAASAAASAPAAAAPDASRAMTGPAAAATVSIPVSGMHCGGCAGRVTRALQAVEGVKAAEVLLAEKRAVVTYDPARVQPAALAAAIRETGYEPGDPAAVTN